MKTPEDEAFDELARKQGAWGGGFPAKRAMAADKLQEPVTVPAQKPCGWQFYSAGKWHNGIGTNDHRANTEADGIPTRNVYTWDDCLETVARVWGALGPSTPLPAQEPPSAYESLVRDMTTIAAREVPRGIPIAEFAMHALADAERREHPAPPLPAQEPVACARCKDLEEQAYDLLGQLKAANLKWSVAHPQPAQEPAAMDNHQTLEALKYAASKGYGRIARKNSAPFTIKEASAQQAQEPDWKTMPPKDAPLVQWVKEQTAPPPPVQQVQFLAGGTRFKLSLDDDGKVNCFGHWKELDGRWVALVAAEDDCHLTLTAPLPVQPAQEPVACVQDLDEVKRKHLVYEKGMDWKDPLYTTPPQREWVGLTGDELADLWYKESLDWMEFARAHEAKLKERNHGT